MEKSTFDSCWQGNDISVDFKCVAIDKMGSFSRGKGIKNENLLPIGQPCITYGQIYTKYNETIDEITTFIDENIAKTSVLIKKGDILFTASGETQEEIGKASVYLCDFPCYAGGDIHILRPNKEYDSTYLAYLFNSDLYHRQRLKLGQGYSIVHIQNVHLKRIILPLPKKSEQTKIAEILSTWNKAIGLLDRKILALEEYRTALMRDMVLKYFYVQKQSQNNNKLKYYLKSKLEFVGDRDILPVSVGVNGIRLRSEIFSKELSSDYSKNKVLHKNDLCFGIGTNNIVYDVLLDEKEYCVSPAYRIYGIKHIDPFYLKCYLDTLNEYYSNKYMIVSARQGKSVDMDGLLNEVIFIPDLQKQIEITGIVKSVDRLINLSKQEKSLVRRQKQGLMQQLLTGKIRVKVD